ncbi:chymase-like [Metopolophium dirhodum]|uniref:chymase-like n=1 Tax=Metopolophium dirhodum TaxID=44670 RepID=UPI00298F5EB5|nr:chymase-like [Metopolophium dirhodum]
MKTIIIVLLSIKAAYLIEKNSTNHINLISNGDQYDPKEFPYVVTIKLYIEVEKISYLTCTGSLVRKTFVLTAAHCVFKRSLSLIEVYAGPAYDNYNYHRVKKGYMNKGYNPNNTHIVSDIALLKLKTPFPQVKKYIEIGGHPDEFANDKAVDCTCIGFGRINEEGDMGVEGRRMDTKVKHGETACKGNPERGWREYLCSATGTRTMTCTGDSGGPMICNGKLYGITSFYKNFTQGKMSCGGDNMQTVHVFLHYHLKWINNILNRKEGSEDDKKKKKKKKKKNSGNSVKPHLTMYTILSILSILFCKVY